MPFRRVHVPGEREEHRRRDALRAVLRRRRAAAEARLHLGPGLHPDVPRQLRRRAERREMLLNKICCVCLERRPIDWWRDPRSDPKPQLRGRVEQREPLHPRDVLLSELMTTWWRWCENVKMGHGPMTCSQMQQCCAARHVVRCKFPHQHGRASHALPMSCFNKQLCASTSCPHRENPPNKNDDISYSFL